MMEGCWFKRCCLSCLQLLLLAVVQTDAYVAVNLERHCKTDSTPSILYLQPEGLYAAALVQLYANAPAPDWRCQLEVRAPPDHLLTVHLVQTQQKEPFRAPLLRKRNGFQPCSLKLSRKLSCLSSPPKDDSLPLKRFAKTFDLCDASNVPVNSLVLTNHLTVTWSAPDAELAERMVASHIVITAVGKGAELCSSRHRKLCLAGHLQLCIPSELVCDGFHNCPVSGEDENPRECAATAALLSDPHETIGDFFTKAVVRAITLKNDKTKEVNTTSTVAPSGKKGSSGLELTPMFSDVSSFIIKNILNNHKTIRVNATTTTTTTTTAKPPWHHQPPKNPTEMDSIPAALAHYGPWGYLMLGMLICGAVLMLCGLWECCCRSSKHRLPPGGPISTSAATTVFIINSAPHRNSTHSQSPEESPPTPGPPSYDELDQPPPYSSLFPMTKLASSEAINIEGNPVITGNHIITRVYFMEKCTGNNVSLIMYDIYDGFIIILFYFIHISKLINILRISTSID
ncbi:hypothetical protein C0J52_04662 [Blattella germanica]|nr:hypothetical protein C0J52_04662 [Blattella germanica]